ncbi:diguanylate cyclase [Vibrio genomosp. F10 str. ZF-129]|uniref:diguanylate cyclase n=1 Tax=Vibrio genomosp. F10 str. ZF-129 TaxID=1187848 RepID=A0A1E5BGT5_9VIBR|nr:GGDEF domain-containing protein [Vibrio genomosp. F10]OEE35830.1 diguanylate cyclase [Vibrio genomosp. F10 str. ZF-129]
MSSNYLDSTDRIRKTVLSSVSFAFFFIVTALAIFNVVYHSQYLFAALEMVFALFSLYMFIRCRRGQYSVVSVYWYLWFIAVLIILGTALLPITDVLFLWGFFFPTIAYLLLGGRLGFQLSLIVLVLVLSAVSYKVFGTEGLPFAPVFINFFTCYLAIWCVSHFFELSRAQANESLQKLALTDSLTGCNNRLAFTESLESHSDDYLLMLDIDDFKSINDDYGHDIGDFVLKKISQQLMKDVELNRIFRIGGEEFCVWLSASDIDSALAKADGLRDNVARLLVNIEGSMISLSFSGGLVKNKQGLSESDLLKRADRLLYKAKAQGKDQVIASSEREVFEPVLVG